MAEEEEEEEDEDEEETEEEATERIKTELAEKYDEETEYTSSILVCRIFSSYSRISTGGRRFRLPLNRFLDLLVLKECNYFCGGVSQGDDAAKEKQTTVELEKRFVFSNIKNVKASILLKML